MKVSIIGLGKLGASLAASFAQRGIDVVGIDCNPEVIASVGRREPLNYEPGLREALREAGGRLVVTTDITRAVTDTDITIVLVPTPSLEDGAFSNEYVLTACRQLGEALKTHKAIGRYHVVVIASTVMPGSCEGPILVTLEEARGRQIESGRFGLCYCPEFIALGNALEGFVHPDFVLIGESDAYAGGKLEALYRRFCDNDPPIFRTNLINAEIAKIALNFYVTTKITVANMLARLCERFPGANVDRVTQAIGLDSRIGRKYLIGATGFGGPCFSRDVRTMMFLFKQAGMFDDLPTAIHRMNVRQFQHILCKVEDARVKFIKGSVGVLGPDGPFIIVQQRKMKYTKSSVGILGLAFKSGTDLTTMATGQMLVKALEGVCPLYVYDLVAVCEHSVCSLQECVNRASVVVVTLPEKAFREAVFHEGQVVIDCWRVLDRVRVEEAGAVYVAIGRGKGA